MPANLTWLKGPTRKLKKPYNYEVHNNGDDDLKRCHVLKPTLKKTKMVLAFIFSYFQRYLVFGFFFES